VFDAVKSKAKVRGVPYTRYIREVLEQATTAKPERPRR
jgi:predicted DNA binding CopG/RHH family protein